jgi:K+-transporting ATPase ATPase A chain
VAYSSGAAASMIAVTGLTGVHNAGTLNFIQVLYEYTSAAANNGSDFFGAAANIPFWNISTGVVILLGRYLPIGVLLALSGSMIGRKRSNEAGLRTDSIVFSVVLIGSIILLVVLTFFPFLALGPILSFFQGHVNDFG